MSKQIKVCILGLGYIGLPTSLLLSRSGFRVIGVDINEDVINSLRNNKIHISEPSLNNLLKKSLNEKTFIPTTVPREADIFLIAVPTPFREDKSKIPYPDISFIINAIKMISKVYKPNNLVIIESTSPVGTSEKVFEILSEKSNLNKNQILLAYCPERVLPGQILQELVHNNRVIGGINEESSLAAHNFYKSFCKGKITITNSRTAELIKLTENAYRDVNIAFANEISMICHDQEINTAELINLANDHPRVNILNPGCGVGGHCIAVDPWFIASQQPDNTPLIQTARKVNNFKTEWCIEIIKLKYKELKNSLNKEPIIGCLGLTYKPNVDDLRESPGLEITKNLFKERFKILICEPNIKTIKFFDLYDLDYVLKNSDIIVILVAHNEFKSIKYNKNNILDFCYINN